MFPAPACRRAPQVVFAVVGAVAYLLLPADLIPESVFGVLGLVDDFLVAACAVLFVAGTVHAFIVNRMGIAAGPL